MNDAIYLALLAGALAAWVAWLFFQRTREVRALERQRLLTIARLADKFPSTDSFIAFLQSSEGRGLFGEVDRRMHVLRTVLRFVQLGCIATVIGLSLFWNAARLSDHADAHSLQQVDERSYWAISLLGLGGGLFMAGGASYLLARRLRLLDEVR